MPTAHPASAWPVPDYDVAIHPALRHPEPRRLLPGARTYTDVVYEIDLGWRPLRADIHVPEAAEQPVPVAVYAHGGSFIGGTRQMGPWTTMPAAGIAVVSIDYRLSGECDFPVPIEDYCAAVRWVRHNAGCYGLDDRRVSGWGTSAGAYLAGMAALTGSRSPDRDGLPEDPGDLLSSVVLHAPTTDFSLLREDAFGASDEALADFELVATAFLGSDVHGARARRASMLEAAHQAASPPPFLIMHGDQDRRVGVGQSRRLHRALQVAGGDVVLHELPGADHMSEDFAHPDAVKVATDFLWRSWHSTGADARQDPDGLPAAGAGARRAPDSTPRGGRPA